MTARNSASRLSVPTPTVNANATTKLYVDDEIVDNLEQLSGAIKSGIKGGTTAVWRRRDMPHQPDGLSPYVVTETVTVNSTSTTISSGASYGVPSGRLTYLGGVTLHADSSAGSAYKFDWKYPDGGGSPNGYPNPKGWGVQFDIMAASEIEFLVYARTGAAWLLLIDGKRVWDIPRTTALTYNAHNLIKFTLPDTGMHRIQFLMSNLSLRTVFATTGATPFPRPPRGPRAFFLGDSLTQGGGYATGGDLASWIYRFSEMCGWEDVWNGGIGSTGPIATNTGASASYLTRATTDILPAAPDVVVITSYYNDKDAQTAAAIATAIGSTIDIIQAALPNTMVLVVGSWDPAGTNGSPYTTIDAAVQPACQTRGVPFIEPRTGNVFDGLGNQLLTNGTAVWVTTTNSAVINPGMPGNIHFGDNGSKFIAYRVYNALRMLLPA